MGLSGFIQGFWKMFCIYNRVTVPVQCNVCTFRGYKDCLTLKPLAVKTILDSSKDKQSFEQQHRDESSAQFILHLKSNKQANVKCTSLDLEKKCRSV